MDIEFWKKQYTLYIKRGDIINTKIVEARRDPITGKLAIINAERPKKPVKDLSPNLDSSTCVFCGENLQKTGSPIYYDDGIYAIIHNINPYFEKHAVFIFRRNEHVYTIEQLHYLDFYHMFRLASKYFKENYKENPSLKYVFIDMNHGSSAGATEEHLHTHLLQSSFPLTYHAILENKSFEYFKKTRRYLLEDLVKIERKNGERFIYNTDRVSWIATFAPSGCYEVIGIIRLFSIMNSADNVLKELAKDIFEFILTYKETLELDYFNFSIFDPIFYKEGGMLPYIRIIGRCGLKKFSEFGHLETTQDTYVAAYYPEELAKKLRKK